MKLKSYLTLLTMLIFVGLISGCSDSVTTPGSQTRTVNGTVLAVDGTPHSSVTVSIENKTAITTSAGTFSIADVTSPYDVKLLKTESGFSNGVQYIGLNNFSPSLTLMTNPSNFLSSTIQITLPFSLGANQHGAVFYSDNTNVFAVVQIQPGQSGTNITPTWTGPSTVNGTIYILIYTQLGLSISSYDNYGEVSFNINAGSTQTKNVTMSEISTNPQESVVSGVVNAPTGYPEVSTTLNISPSKGLYGGITIGSINPGFGFSHVAPVGLSSNLHLSVVALAQGPLGKTSAGKTFVQPGASGVQVNLSQGPDLNTPANNSSGIDTNTIFTYTPVTGAGLYQLIFASGNRSFMVFTAGTSAVIPNFNPFGVGLGNNMNYSWSVTAYNSSIDNFISTRLDNNQHLTGLSNSQTWFFTSN